MREKIGIIGFGNMGLAIAERIKAKYPIYIFDKDLNKVKNVFGMTVSDSIDDLINKVGIIIIAVKPQDFTDVLSAILDKSKDCIKEKLIISIAAGITTNFIEIYLDRVRVIRVMPNMPSRIGEGMSCICKGRYATAKDLNFAQQLFKNLGQTLVLKEDMMDAATAISGSGPAYVYDFIESQFIDYHNIPTQKIKDFTISFRDAAESLGFNKKQARILVDTTIRGALATLQAGEVPPSQLKKQVVSKGGTTEAALEILHNSGYSKKSFKKAVKAAWKRAKQLSRG